LFNNLSFSHRNSTVRGELKMCHVGRIAGVAGLVVIVFALRANAESVFITGHDSDSHGNGQYQRAGYDFLTFGAAATPAQALLRATIKIGYLGNDDGRNLGNAIAESGYTNQTFIDLDNANWETIAFAPGAFDILVIGTGLDQVHTSGSAKLNAAASQFATFFNAGGDLYVNSEQGVGQSFYNFLPTFGASSSAISSSNTFSVTSAGLAIGLTEAIVDADITHDYFTNVDLSKFTVFETYNIAGSPPVAIGFKGSIQNGEFESVPLPAPFIAAGVLLGSLGLRRRSTHQV
jgi:hypothetical protein